METKEIIDILTAFEEGKTIEYKCLDMDIPVGDQPAIIYGEWIEITGGVRDICHYIDKGYPIRVQPETTLRPYKDADEFIKASIEHGEWLRPKNPSSSPHALRYVHPIMVTNSYIMRGCDERMFYNTMVDGFVWLDGSPCGVLEE